MPPHRGFAGAAAGFTYVGVLVAVALAGLALAGAGAVWSTLAQREREAELLFVGDQYRRAIASYFDTSPGPKEYPRSLADLLEDRRSPAARRHLRKPFADPMAPQAEWGLVRIGDRVQGVYSTSAATPIKRAGFAAVDESFAGASSYRDWRFVAIPGGGVAGDGSTATPNPNGAGGATEFPGLPAVRAAPTTVVTTETPAAHEPCADARASDLANCARIALERPNDRAQCMSSAAQRFAICRRGGARAMPPLGAPGREP